MGRVDQGIKEYATEELLWKTSSKRRFAVVKTKRAPGMENQSSMKDVEGTSEAAADKLLKRQKFDKIRLHRHLNKMIPRFQSVVDQMPARKKRKKLVKDEKETVKNMRDLSLEMYEESKGPIEKELGKSEVATAHQEESAEDVSNDKLPSQTSPLKW